MKSKKEISKQNKSIYTPPNNYDPTITAIKSGTASSSDWVQVNN